MPLELTPEQIVDVWSESEGDRAALQEHREYLNGEQSILQKKGTRRDGTSYNKIVVNWVGDIVDRHVGFLVGENPALIIPEDAPPDQEEALENYDALSAELNLDAMNARQYRDALALGYRVEVHGMEAEDKASALPQIVDIGAENWAFVENENGEILAAINKTVLPKGSVFEEEFLDEDLSLWHVYDDATLTVYTSPGEQDLQQRGEPTEHYYEQVPVFRWTASPGLAPLTDEAFLTLQDSYNNLVSGHLDDCDTDFDAMLALYGINPKSPFEPATDEHGQPTGKTNIEQIREEKVIAFPDRDSGAEFLTRNLSVDKVTYTEQLLRASIHITGRVPDLAEIVGTTGATSGIALRLAFQRMLEYSISRQKYIRQSIDKRVELLNVMWAKNGQPTLDDYDVQFTFSIPSNDKEATETALSLADLLSPVDVLRRVPGIEDPAKAVENRVEWEKNNAANGVEGVEGVEGVALDEGSELPPAEEVIAEKLSLLPDIESLLETASAGLEDEIERALSREGQPAPPREVIEEIIRRIIELLEAEEDDEEA